MDTQNTQPNSFKDQFSSAITDYATGNQFGVSQIPVHSHTGVDSPHVDISNIENFVKNPTNGQIPVFDTSTNKWIGGSRDLAPTQIFLPFNLNLVAETYNYCPSISNDWKRIFIPNGSSAGNIGGYYNPSGNSLGTWFYFAAPASFVYVNATVFSAYDKTLNYFFAAENTGSDIYRYNNDDNFSGEVKLTISGTTFTNIKGIASDGTNFFVFDGGTNVVKKLTLAATTLTYVSTITLDESSAKRYLAVDDNYIYSYDTALAKYWTYNKTTGVSVSHLVTILNSGERQRGLFIDPEGYLRQLISNATPANTQQNYYITRIILN